MTTTRPVGTSCEEAVGADESAAFLQGIEYDSSATDVMFESTGLYGQSVVRRWNLQSGEVLLETKLDAEFFGEGLTLVGDELFVLTWKENVVFVFDRATLSEKRRLKLSTDGGRVRARLPLLALTLLAGRQAGASAPLATARLPSPTARRRCSSTTPRRWS